MAREHAVIFEHELRIPTDAFTEGGFADWVGSESFPETGRIDFLAGDVEVERSPEDLYTHGVVKTAVVLTLGDLIVRTDLGDVFTDSTRVTSHFAQLSAEPDVVVSSARPSKAGASVSCRRCPERRTGTWPSRALPIWSSRS